MKYLHRSHMFKKTKNLKWLQIEQQILQIIVGKVANIYINKLGKIKIKKDYSQIRGIYNNNMNDCQKRKRN